MKYIHLILLILFPFATLFAQVNDPDYATPDSLEVELNEQEINDLSRLLSSSESSADEERQEHRPHFWRHYKTRLYREASR